MGGPAAAPPTLMQSHQRPDIVPPALLFGLLFLLSILPWCGVATIGGSSEARETHVVSSILQNDTWVLPLRNGVVPSKPPLFHWVAAQVAQIRGGATPGVTRAVSASFAALTLMLIAALAAHWTLAREGTNALIQARQAAFISAVVLSLSYGFLSLAIDARVDMTLCACIISALYFPLSSVAATATPYSQATLMPPSARSLRYFWLFCGVAVIAKGPVGMVLPLSILCAILIDLFGLQRGLKLALLQPRGWLLCSAVALPWYLIAINEGGGDFIQRQLVFENLQRFTGGDFVNQEKWWFYIPSFLTTCAPWSLLVFYQAALELFTRKTPERNSASNPFVRICILWIGVPLILLSAASGKRHSYLLPLLPAVALMCSQIKLSVHSQSRLTKFLPHVSKLICLALCLSVLAFNALTWAILPYTAVIDAARDFLSSQARYAQLIFGLAAFALLLLWSTPRAVVTWLACLTLMLGWLALGIGIKNHLKGFDRIAAAINQRVPAEQQIFLPKHPRDEYFDPVLYYIGRKVTLVSENFDACAMTGFVIAHRAWLEELSDAKRACLKEIFAARTIPDQQQKRTEREIVLLRGVL